MPQRQIKRDEGRYEQEVSQCEELLDRLKVRQRRTIERKIKKHEIKFSKKKGGFVYVNDEDKDYDIGVDDDDDDDMDDLDGLDDDDSGDDDDDQKDGAPD